MIDLSFDNGTVEQLSLVLSRRDYTHLGILSNVQHIKFKKNLNAADELSFEVYKTLDDHEEILWDEIYDLRLIWISELDEYFEINVASTDTIFIKKTITAKSLCESELSQTYLNKVEINTAADIARPEYNANYPTVFYRDLSGLDTDTEEYKLKKNSSLLHRILEKVPAYTIEHVDTSLCNQQRVFSISNSTLYNFLTGDCADQFNCLFQFNSAKRSISVYDLNTVCRDCGNRGDFRDVCPKCGSTNLQYFGTDTTVFVSTDNLTDEVKFETDVNSMKNCFRLEAGDDDMTAAVINSNPNGSRYIYEFNEETLRDMPEELGGEEGLIATYNDYYNNVYNENKMPLKAPAAVIAAFNDLCEKYNTYSEISNPSFGVNPKEKGWYEKSLSSYVLTNDTHVVSQKTYYESNYKWEKIPVDGSGSANILGYKNLMPYYYNCIDFYSYLMSSMMPDPVEETYSIEEEKQHIINGLASLTGKIGNVTRSNVIGLSSTPASESFVESSIENICQTFINTGIYKISIITTDFNWGIPSETTGYWQGSITLTSFEDDTITQTITYGSSNQLYLTTDLAVYMEQNISKFIKRDKNTIDLYDVLTIPWNEGSSDGSEFRMELSKYSVARLKSFSSALQGVLDVLIQAEQNEPKKEKVIYEAINERTESAKIKALSDINPYAKGWYVRKEDGSYEPVPESETHITNLDKKYYSAYHYFGYEIINTEQYLKEDPRNINPFERGWYEYNSSDKMYHHTFDKHVDNTKTYYTRNRDFSFSKVHIKPALSPKNEGWYEVTGNGKAGLNADRTTKINTYYLSADTEVNYRKMYYKQVTNTRYVEELLPTVNPKARKWYELYGIQYIPTEDTTVVEDPNPSGNNNKVYYQEKVIVKQADLYDDFYRPYTKKATAVESELANRESEAKTVGGKLDSEGKYVAKGILQYITECIADIQKSLEFSTYIFNATKSYDLYFLYTTYIREDTYNNANYISTDLSNDKLFENAGLFLEAAKEELHKSAHYQHSISTNINNLMAIKEFKPLLKNFELGNWIRVQEDETIYRLRLISYTIDYDDIAQLNTEFSDVTVTADGLSDVKSILGQASTMASSYGYVQKQASTGADVMYNYIDDWVTNGLNSALIRINSNTDETVTIDNAGITARTYDDITDDYGPEQLRITHNILAFTDDNWETVKTALGKFTMSHHIINSIGVNKDLEPTSDPEYGLVADAVLAGWIVGSYMESGTIIASHIQNVGNGNYMDLGSNTSDNDLKYFLKCGSNFTVDKSGNLKCQNANLTNAYVEGEIQATSGTFKGRIEAAQGYIGNSDKVGWNIGTQAIYNGCLGVDNGNQGIYIGTDGIRYNGLSNKYFKFSDGTIMGNEVYLYNSSGTIIFSVNNEGLSLNGNGNFTGYVKANSGYIGNWTLTAMSGGAYGNGSMYYLATGATMGVGTSCLLSPVGYTTAFTTAGNKRFGWTSATGDLTKTWALGVNNNFGVTTGGILYASGAIISGTLTAGANSKIGSWVVASDNIHYNNETYNTGRYFGSSGLSVNGNFYVTDGGILHASGVSISGGITASSGKIGNWSIEDGTGKYGLGALHYHPSTSTSPYILSPVGTSLEGNNIPQMPGTTTRKQVNVRFGNNFAIDTKGNVYMKGTITASSGSIGAWTIDTDLKGEIDSSHASWLSPKYIHIIGKVSSTWKQFIINPEKDRFGIRVGSSGSFIVTNSTSVVDHTTTLEQGNYISIGTNNVYSSSRDCNVVWHSELSDARYKNNIKDISAINIRKFYNTISPSSFKFNKNAEGKDDLIHYGIIAQNLKAALQYANFKSDSLVKHNMEKDIYYVSYQEFHGLELAGIKDLYEIVNKQQSQIDFLTQELTRLKGEQNG